MGFSEDLRHFSGAFKRRRLFRFGAAYAVVAWVMLQLAEIVFPAFAIPDSTMRLLVIGSISGFPVVLTVAWLVDRGDPNAARSRWLEFVFLGLVAVICLSFAWLLYEPVPSNPDIASTESLEPSIAVMPFVNMSDDASNEYFSDGISEELLNVLARIDGLKVAARTSSFAYKGQAGDVRDFARELGVGNILEGSVRKIANTVRVTAQLIDAADGTHLWSQTYDRELTDVFAIQDEISAAIVDALKVKLLDSDRAEMAERPTDDIDAYNLYLLGRHHWRLRTADDIDLAADYFERAVAADPDYVPAYTGLADAYLLQSSYGNRVRAEVAPLAEAAARKALELDPELAEAHASMGLVYEHQARLDDALASHERAIELDPEYAMARLWYGNVLQNVNRREESFEQYRRAYALEPMSKPININIAWAHYERGAYALARPHFERLKRLDPANLGFYARSVALTYANEGKLARAVQAYREALAISPDNEDAMAELSAVYLALGDLEEAQFWATMASEVDPLDGDTMRAEIFVRVAARRLEDIGPYVEDIFAIGQSRRNPFAITLIAMINLMQGDEASAASYFDEYFDFYGGSFHSHANDPWPTLAAAYYVINHEGGERVNSAMQALNESRERIQQRLSQGIRSADAYYALAELEAVAGNRDASMAALENAIEIGWRAVWLAKVDPLLTVVRDDPAFFPMMQRLEDHIAAEADELMDLPLAEYQPPERWQPVAVSPELLTRYEGYYRYSNSDTPVQFYVQDDALYMQSGGHPAWRLSAMSETEFFAPLRRDRYRFALDENGEVTHLISAAAGGESRAKRIDYQRPAEIELDQTLLEAYVGAYEMTQNAVTLTITLSNGALYGQVDGGQVLRMRPFAEDRFFIEESLATFTFVKDPSSSSATAMIIHDDGADIEAPRITADPI